MKKSSSQTSDPRALLRLERCPPYALIISPDGVRPSRLIAKFIETYFSPEGVRPEQLRAEELSIQQIRALRDSLFSLSLFSTKRLVVLQNVDQLKGDLSQAALALLKELDRAPAEGVCLLLVGEELAANSVLRKQCAAAQRLAIFENLDGAELTAWCEKELRRAGVNKWEPQVPHTLAAAAEGSVDRAHALISHLEVYLDGESATIDSLQQLFPGRVHASEYDLVDSITSRKPLEALVLTRKVLASGKNPFLLLSLLSRSIISYSRIKSLLTASASRDQMRDQLRLPPWLLDKQLSAASRFTTGELMEGIRSLLRADSLLKNRSLGPDSVIEELVGKLSAR